MANAADIMVDTLIAWNVEVVFGLPGDGINGIMEALRTLTLTWWAGEASTAGGACRIGLAKLLAQRVLVVGKDNGPMAKGK